MGQSLLTLVEILRLRAGPQDLPSGWGLAGVLMLAYVFQGFVADKVLDETQALPSSVVALFVQLGAIAALLRWKGLPERLPQTVSALAGTGFILGLVSVVLLAQADPGRQQPVLALAYLLLFGWSLVVDASIYRHALSIAMSRGVLIAVLIFAASFILIRAMFG